MRIFLGVLAWALLSSCAHVHEDSGWAGDGGSARDRDSQVGESGEGPSSLPSARDQASGDEGASALDAGSPMGDGDGPVVVDRPGEDGNAIDAGPAEVADAAGVQLFPPVTVQSEVLSEHATPSDDIVIMWRTFHDPSEQYFPIRAAYEGNLDRFRVILPDEPPAAGLYQIEDPETGLEPPDAPWIAAGSIYRVVGGKLEGNPSGVTSLDTDVVIGQTRGVIVWTPVELPPGWHLSTKGIARSSDEPLSAGYHLFVDFVEVDLGTQLTLSNDIWT